MGLIKNLKDKLTKKVDNFLAKKVEGVPPEIGTLSQEENEDETPKEGKSEDFDSGLNKEYKKEKKKNLLEDEEEPEENEEDQEDEEQQQEKLQKKKQKINSKSNLTDRPIGEQFDEELRKVSKKSPKNKDASFKPKPLASLIFKSKSSGFSPVNPINILFDIFCHLWQLSRIP